MAFAPSIPTRPSGRSAARSAFALTALVLALAPYGVLPIDGALAAEVVVRITDRLEPAQVTVAPGTTVTWVNEDGERHRVRSESGPTRFDSGNLETGESFSFGFTEPGEYRYVDARNDDEQAYWGTVVVTANEAPPPDPPPDPGPPPPPPPPGGGGGETVSIGDRVYVPFTVTVPVGSSVSWRNNDDRIHTVTSTGGLFDSGIMQVGDLYSRTFNQAGAFDYFCTVHPDMTGSVIVTGDEAVPDPPPDDPPPEPDPGPPPDPGPAPSGDVRIVDFSYSPQSITVAAGTSLTFANAGAAPHTVTATAGGFDSGLLLAGDTYRRSFPTPGTYDYFCTVHPEMTGRVVVTGSAAPGPTPPEPDPPPEPPDPDPPPGPPPSGDVRIVDLAYSPRSLTVAAGTTVTWANAGDLPHTVTAPNGSFDSGIMLASDTYRRRFATPGTYEYLCTIHPAMTARVVVTGAASGAGGTDAADSAAAEPDAGALRPLPDAAAPFSGEPAQVAGSSSDAAPAAAAPVLAEMIDFDYDPAVVTVPVGGSVEWRNAGVAPHTVTARDGSFDSGLVVTGDAWVGTFGTIGEWEYFCTVHPNMTGTLRVVPAASEAAPIGAQAPAAGPTIDFSQLASESLLPEPTGTSPLHGALLVAMGVVAVAIVAAGAALAQPFRRPPAA